MLNLSWNGFEDEGASAIGKGLVQNGVLQDLDICCNRISPQGFLDLLKGLGKNDTLETLRVRSAVTAVIDPRDVESKSG